VRARGGAFVDATFRRQADREAFAQAFAGAAPVTFAQCDAPVSVLAERARQRRTGERHGSDATVAVVLRELQRWEPLDDVPAPEHVIIRSDRPVDVLVAELACLLDERLRQASTGLRAR
jgi:predicted kinase